MLKWLRAVIMVYVSTGIKHQKCVLFRKRDRPALVLSSEEQAKFPIQPARAALILQNYYPGVEINKNHFPIALVSQEKTQNLRE